jgi:hypothetical protein
MTTETELHDSFDRMARKALRVKEDRDRLLAACKTAYNALDNIYDVDEPEPGRKIEHPFSGAGQVMRKLRTAIDSAEED